MTTRTTTALLASTLTLFGACSWGEEPDNLDDAVSAVEDAARDAARETRDAARETRDAARETREEVREAREEVREAELPSRAQMRTKLGRLEIEYDQLEADAKAAGRKLDDEAPEARRRARMAANKLEHASETAWDDARESTSKALERLEAEIAEARTHVDPSS